MKKTNAKTKVPTLEEVWQMLAEITRIQEETTRRQEEIIRFQEEEARRQKEAAIRLKKENDRRQKENDRAFEKLRENIDGVSKSNGAVAEEYFENIFKKEKAFAGMHFDEIKARELYRNAEGRADEFDIIMMNDKNVAIIETKYKAREKDFDQLVKKANAFRYWYPKHNKHKIYLGLAGMRFNDDLVEKAKKRGIAVIRQLGGKIEIKDKKLKAY